MQNTATNQRRTLFYNLDKVFRPNDEDDPGIPGGRGQFSLLQAALLDAKGNRIRVNESVRAQLRNLHYLIADLASRPTHMEELIPKDQPRFMGASDVAKAGMGGVWLPPREEDRLTQPIVWRAPFPTNVQMQVVSTLNPKGKITNSNLELAATICASSHPGKYARHRG